jgi:predicted O-linked N-acetylglucosamine transferase (SPINDLY family)
MELVDRVNKGELIASEQLEIYQESPNSAEKFLAHHAHAMLDLRQAHQHMLQSLEAIDYSDQKVLNQFISVSQFLGLTDLRAEPIVKFGASAVGRREYALGIEAIQNGMEYDLRHGGTYSRDRETCQFVAAQYERVAQCAGWSAGESLEHNNKLTKIAYVVSGLGDEEPAARAIRSLARSHDSKRFKLQVYSTEAGVRREKQQFAPSAPAAPSAKRGTQTMEQLGKMKVPAWTAPLEGDSLSAARDLANQLVKDKIDVVIFDATQADPIAAVVANWEVAGVKINLCRRTPLYANGIQCVTYLDQGRYEADKDHWQSKGIESRFILEGIDLEENLGPAPQRSAFGIPEQAVVLATASSDPDRSISPEFVDTVINILRAHPHAVYLMIGEGDMAWQKRKFESAGVAKRIGYSQKRKDLPGFLRLADLYLAEFPSAGAAGVLQAMSVEKPVVAMLWGEEVEQSQAAAFAGSECTISGRDTNAFVERVSKLIREPAYRQKLGKAMRGRVEQHFAFAQTARHLEQLCDQLIQQRGEASITLEEPAEIAERPQTLTQAA